jgi:sialic acid synthase SpsE
MPHPKMTNFAHSHPYNKAKQVNYPHQVEIKKNTCTTAVEMFQSIIETTVDKTLDVVITVYERESCDGLEQTTVEVKQVSSKGIEQDDLSWQRLSTIGGKCWNSIRQRYPGCISWGAVNSL